MENEYGIPGERVCHRMVIDTSQQKLYLLGNYFGSSRETEVPPDARTDFWEFDISKKVWTCLSYDTSKDGGPAAIFDHGMSVDEKRGIVYVSGGCKWDPDELVFEGLYAYDTKNRIWEQLAVRYEDRQKHCEFKIERMGHCMEYFPDENKLYIFGGQSYDQEFILDMCYIKLETREAVQHVRKNDTSQSPSPSFCQRSIMDSKNHRIFTMFGFEQRNIHKVLRPSLWIFYITTEEWVKISDINEEEGNEHPCSRFGHAVAADLNRNIIYLMGGNASTHPLRPMKLSDFWKLDILDRWGIKHCLSNVSLQLHLHRFHELVSENLAKAVEYLQKSMQPQFDKSPLFWNALILDAFSGTHKNKDIAQRRFETFQTIYDLLPVDENTVAPNESLLNMIEFFT